MTNSNFFPLNQANKTFTQNRVELATRLKSIIDTVTKSDVDIAGNVRLSNSLDNCGLNAEGYSNIVLKIRTDLVSYMSENVSEKMVKLSADIKSIGENDLLSGTLILPEVINFDVDFDVRIMPNNSNRVIDVEKTKVLINSLREFFFDQAAEIKKLF